VPLRAGLAAYAGDLAADEPYLDWLVPRRERLAQLRLGAAVELAALDLDDAVPLAAESALLDLLRDDPAAEAAHRALIRAYAAAGQPERARRQLDACRAALAEHLAANPAPETVAALDQPPVAAPRPVPLASATPDTPRRRFGRLPAPPTRLIGRDRELEEIAGALLGGESRLVTLVGPGGIGKTHLALEAARVAEPDIAGGAAWVPLAAMRDPDLVPAAVARALGVADVGDRPTEDALADVVADRAILLVVDNLEQVVEAAPVLARLLAASPASMVLATSRRRLNLRGERVVEVPPLPAGTDGAALFAARAAEASAPVPADAHDAVVEICRRLDGIPLAIELAAAASRHLPLVELLGRIGSRLDLLVDGPRDADDRQRTMRAAVAWSDDLLTPSQRATFRRLGVFAGGAPSDLVARVLADPPSRDTHGSGQATVVPSRASDLDADLAALVDAHLVRAEARDGGPRYLLLETVRAYAVERLAATGELASVAGAHVAAYADLAARAADGLNGPDQFAWLDRLEEEHDDLWAAATWAFDQGNSADVLRIVTGILRFAALRGHHREWSERIERALAVTEEADPLVEAAALRAAGVLRQELRDYPGAERRYLDGLTHLPSTPAGELLHCRILMGLGDLDLFWGRYPAARTRFDDALAAATAASNPYLASLAEARLGRLALNEGDHAEVVRRSSVALAGNDDPDVPAAVLKDLAIVHFEREDYAAMRPVVEESLAIARRAGDLFGIALYHVGLAAVADGLGEPGALTYLEEALARFVALGDPLGEAGARQWHAGALCRAGDHRGALATLGRGIALMCDLGGPDMSVEFLDELVPPLVRLGRADAAARLLGANDASRDATGYLRQHRAVRVFAEYRAELEAALVPDDLATHLADGALLPLDAALAEALTRCRELAHAP